MDHVILADIFRQYDHQYLSLRAELDKIPTTERWARGVCDPCRLEPYYIEMLGDKPGCFVKKTGAPGKNMWLCRYDACNALLYKCEFQQRLRSGDWSHSDTFYIYGDDYALELTYHSAFEDYTKKEISVSLARLVYAALETGRMIRSFQYFSPDDYSESIYSYEDGKITSILCKIQTRFYVERNFQITHTNSHVVITDITDKTKHIPIFPPLK